MLPGMVRGYVSLLRMAHRVRKVYWRLLRPTTLGSLCIVPSGDRVLLVRQVYEKGWHLPGGGVKWGESFSDAARREVREETGVHVGNVRLFGLYHRRAEAKSDYVAVFLARDFDGAPRPASAEIAEATFVALGALPPDTAKTTRLRLEEYRAQTTRTSGGTNPE